MIFLQQQQQQLQQQSVLLAHFAQSSTATISSLTSTVGASTRGESRGLALDFLAHVEGIASVFPSHFISLLTLGSAPSMLANDRVVIASLSSSINLSRLFAHLRTASFSEDDPLAPKLSDDQLLGFLCFRFLSPSDKHAVQLVDLRADNKTKSTAPAPSDFKGYCRCLVYSCQLFAAIFGP
jgi:hypothetical protein